MWMQLAGIGLSMFSAYQNKKAQADSVDAQNAANAQLFEDNKDIVAEMLSTLDARTSRAESEAVRQSIRTKLSTRKAQIQAEGAATVKAAQIGSGSGVRASLGTFRPAARQAGDIITDTNINLQTELSNITEHFKDSATKAIANLNNSRPIMGTGPSTTEMLLDTTAAGLNAWGNLSEPSKAELKDMFKSDTDVTEPTLLN